MEVLHKFVAHEGKFDEENYYTRECVSLLLRSSRRCQACSVGFYEDLTGVVKEFWMAG